MDLNASNTFYKIGELRTFCHTFDVKNKKVIEYIHCIVIEHLQVFGDDTPKQIRVKQIHNLYDYYQNKESVLTERILSTEKLTLTNNESFYS